MATIQALYGAEHGSTAGLITGNAGNRIFDSLTGTLGSTIEVIAGAAKSGGYGLRVSGANTFARWDTNTLGASRTSLVGTMWWRASTDPSGLKSIVVFDLAGGGTDFSALDYNPATDKLEAWVGASVLASNTTVNPGTWYLIQWLYTISGATNTFDWSIDGVAEPQVTDAHGADTFDGLCFGDRSTGTTGASDFDDIVVSTTAADFPLGQHKVVNLTVDPAGTLTVSGSTGLFRTFAGATPTLSTWNATTARNAIDEVPPNLGSSQDGWCQLTIAGSAHVEMPLTTYTLTTAETVAGARMLACMWADAAATATIGLRTYNGTTERTLFAVGDPGADNSATSPAWVCRMLTAADIDTQAELNALAIRAGFSNDALPAIGLHAVYVEVAIHEGASPTPAAIAASATVGAAVSAGQTATATAITATTAVPAPAVIVSTLTAVPAGGNWNSAATWSPAQVPTAGDNCILNAASGNVVINGTTPVARSLDCTGYTGTLTHNAAATLTLGDTTPGTGNIALMFSAAMTYTKVNATTSAVSFVSTSPVQQTITSAGQTLGNVVFNGAGGSWLFTDTFLGGGSVVLTAGALDTAGVACSSVSFASSNTNVRSLTLGATTWTLTGTTGTIWSTATLTNLTLSAAASTIVYSVASASTRNFAPGGGVYGTLTYTVAGSTGTLGINASATFNTINFSDATNARILRITAGATLTIVNAFNVQGTSGNLMTIDSSSAGSAATLSKTSGTVSCDYLSIKDSAAAGGASWYAGANSTSVSGNSGWIFTPPPTVVAPAVITATASLPSAAAGAGTGVTPAATTATASLPPATTASTLGADPIIATASLPAPTITAGQIVTPAAIIATASMPAVFPVSPLIAVAITATASLPAPAVSTGQRASPVAILAYATLPQGAVSAVNIAVNQVTETDTSQPLTAARGFLVSRAVETDAAQPTAVLKIGLTPLSPGDLDIVMSPRPSFRIGISFTSAVAETLTLNVQYTPATDPEYSDAQFLVDAVTFNRTVTVSGAQSEAVVTPDEDLPLGNYHWRVRGSLDGYPPSEWVPGDAFNFTVDALIADTVPVVWVVSAAVFVTAHLWHLQPGRGVVGDSVTAYGFGFPVAASMVTIAGVAAAITDWDHNTATGAGATSARVINPGVLIDAEHDAAVVTVPTVSAPGGPFVIGHAQTVTSEGYRVSGRYLLDPNGDNLLIVGVEQHLLHVGYMPDGPDLLPQIGLTGANAVRILPNYLGGVGGNPYTVADIDETIEAGLNSGMFVELAVDGGQDPDVYFDAGIMYLINRWQNRIAIHAVGESEADSDDDWADEVTAHILNLRSAGVTCPLYVMSRVFGRSLTCLLNKGATVQAADPLHNIVFGWQAYWGLPSATANKMNSMAGFYQSENGMTLLQAVDACAAQSFPIQVGLEYHTDPDIDMDQVIPYSDLMSALRIRDLGWLWWDYREGVDNLTPSGTYGDWTSLGQSVVEDDANGIANAAVRTTFLQDQIGGDLP